MGQDVFRFGPACQWEAFATRHHDCSIGRYAHHGGSHRGGYRGGRPELLTQYQEAVIPNLTIDNDVSIMGGPIVVHSLFSRVLVGGNPRENLTGF